MKEIVEIGIVSDERVKCPSCGATLNPKSEDIDIVDLDGECGAHRLYSITVKCGCGQLIQLNFDQG